MRPFWRVEAFYFESKLAIEDMLPALNQLGLWRFVERDNDRWGFYISSCAKRPEVGSVKILEDDGRYVVNVKYESTDPQAPTDCAQMWKDLFERILPAIGAGNFEETSSYE
jgi:hypothetical protein